MRPSIGLFCVDCLCYELAIQAIKNTKKKFNFDQIIYFTDKNIKVDIPIQIIPKINSQESYSDFILKKLHTFINTDFALLIQWDGFITNPDIWTNEFFKYDYIGARWPYLDENNVGNGGFSLRSLRLMKIVGNLAKNDLIQVGEDDYICRKLRLKLEKEHSIKFAPASLADLFSYERIPSGFDTFGFHGLHNIWRHLPDKSLTEFIDLIPDYYWDKSEFIECFTHCFYRGKTEIFKRMYKKTRQKKTIDEIYLTLISICSIGDINALIHLGELNE